MSKNVKTINFLGDTLEEQWKNSINVYRMAIESNLTTLKKMGEEEDYFDDEEYFVSYDPRMEYLNVVDSLELHMNNVLYDMNRLVDAMFTKESEE